SWLKQKLQLQKKELLRLRLNQHLNKMNYIRGDEGIIIRCVLLFLCFILSACSQRCVQKKAINDVEKNDVLQSTLLDRIIQQEAMLVNIPFPLYEERILLPFG